MICLSHTSSSQPSYPASNIQTADSYKQLEDPVLIVHALQKLGVELKRAGRNQEAVHCLEEARDTSFNTSKHVAAFANSYLAHIYAATSDTLRFERAIHTALAL